jgi:hypothetical protein
MKKTLPPKKTETHALDIWGKRITAARDIILVGAGAAYVIGFLVWSYNAWREHIGLLPAVQAQYIAAGLVPLLLVSYIPLVAKLSFLNSMISRLAGANTVISTLEELGAAKKIAREAKSVGKSCIRFIMISIMVLAISIAVVTILKHKSHQFLLLDVVIVIEVWLLTGAGFLLGLIRYDKHLAAYGVALGAEFNGQLHNMRRNAMIYGTVASIIIAQATFTYAVYIYPLLPQEFGGMRPRTALLEVKRLDLSPEERKILLPVPSQNEPTDPTKDASPVVQTNIVDVLYDNGDAMELRLEGSKDGRVYDIKRANVVNIIWCGPHDLPKRS